jgi:hypothetical protein
MTGFENVIREKVWLENSLSQFAQAIFKPNLFQYKYPNILNPFILHTYPPMKMEQTQCSETSAYKIQTPGNYPEESIQHSELGEFEIKKAYVRRHLQHCLMLMESWC